MLRSGGASCRAGVDDVAQGAAPLRERRITTVCCDLAVPSLGQELVVRNPSTTRLRAARNRTGEIAVSLGPEPPYTMPLRLLLRPEV